MKVLLLKDVYKLGTLVMLRKLLMVIVEIFF